MSRPKKTLYNPHQLTGKQDLVIKGIVADIENGKGFNNVDNHKKFYNAKSHHVAKSMASENLSKPNFRAGLIYALEKRGVLGRNGKLQQRMAEGLDAKADRKFPDPLGEKKVRLEYIKEVNKVIGAYAPLKVDSRSLTARVKPEELDQEIQGLEVELAE